MLNDKNEYQKQETETEIEIEIESETLRFLKTLRVIKKIVEIFFIIGGVILVIAFANIGVVGMFAFLMVLLYLSIYIFSCVLVVSFIEWKILMLQNVYTFAQNFKQ